ncbi:MAG TPA: DUF1592 domain-containing protein [Polyangiaceae bacterium]|nr:DUF1592 domain-containing protein [Polyangiaceae bacterium]
MVTSPIATTSSKSDRQWCLRTLLASGVLTTALCGALSACTALVEGPTGTQPAPAGPGGGNAGNAGVGSGGSTGTATDPGRVTLHRLSRVEYGNTVHDLLGTSLEPPNRFKIPDDNRGVGVANFDNMADVLTLSPLHLSVYMSAATTVISEALANMTQRASLVPCNDLAAQGEACVREALRAFAYRAWRRPVTDAEIDRLMMVAGAASAEGPEQGLALALRAVLMSPHFVFRVELDPDPTSVTPHPLNPYELASRLSYFLWSSTPDIALLESAKSGALTQPAEFEKQVSRLFDDPRARALIDNFAGQWLQFRAIDSLTPDATKFPMVDPSLLSAMRQEGERLFQDIAFQGAPLKQLLTANYSYVNDRLATHYGLAPVGSSELLRVDLSNNAERGGLLSQAGFLTLTSHKEVTSLVLRGKWVFEELLCGTVPPPPEGVDLTGGGLPPQEGSKQRTTNPQCNFCHNLMDPIGLGLEKYDAIGRYRATDDAAMPIGASGQLPSGQSFSGPKELAALIADDPAFARCAVRKLYSYALGRAPVNEPAHQDGPVVEGLIQALTQNGASFRDLVGRIVTSPTFTHRRGESATEGML